MKQQFVSLPAVATVRALLPKLVPVILVLALVAAVFAIKNAYVDKPLADANRALVKAEKQRDEARADADKESKAKNEALNMVAIAKAENAKWAQIAQVQTKQIERANQFATEQGRKMDAIVQDVNRANARTARTQAAIDNQALILENRLPADPRMEIATAKASLKETKGFDYAKVN